MDDTEAALDEALRAHAAGLLDQDGEVITTWVGIAGTKNYHGDGTTLLLAASTASKWEVRGLLYDALSNLDEPGPGAEDD